MKLAYDGETEEVESADSSTNSKREGGNELDPKFDCAATVRRTLLPPPRGKTNKHGGPTSPDAKKKLTAKGLLREILAGPPVRGRSAVTRVPDTVSTSSSAVSPTASSPSSSPLSEKEVVESSPSRNQEQEVLVTRIASKYRSMAPSTHDGAVATVGDADCEESDDDDDEESDDGEDEVANLNFFRNHCWGCHTWIQHPGLPSAEHTTTCLLGAEAEAESESESEDDRICCAALHLHPLLEVPVCVVCADEIEAVEHKRQQDEGNRRHQTGRKPLRKPSPTSYQAQGDGTLSNACSACGKREYEDEDTTEEIMEEEKQDSWSCMVCKRTICPQCFEQAYQGDGWKICPQLRNAWRCFCGTCAKPESDLPSLLRALRRNTRELFSTSTQKPHKRRQPVEDALGELQCLEMEKQNCESTLDHEEMLLTVTRRELMSEAKENEEDESEDRLERRVRKVHQEWIDYHTRLLDRIGILQDKLKADHGIEAHAAFRLIQKKLSKGKTGSYFIDDSTSDDSSSESDASENEPSWKVSADRAIAKRKMAEKSDRKKDEMKQNLDPRYSLELEDYAEELESYDGGSVGKDSNIPDLFDLGWRNHPIRASDEQIAAAKESEDMRRREEGKTSLIVHSNKSDRQDIQLWDDGLKQTSTETTSGVVRTTTTGTQRRGHTYRLNMVVGRSQSNYVDDFQPSSLVLSHDPLISVDKRFETNLKEHQKEAIRFMYRNSFADLGGDDPHESTQKIGGCILAHSMGLGKSLSCIALLHTIMFQPSLINPMTGRGTICKTVLVVPVNTLVNWENEFGKWTKTLRNKLNIFNISSSAMLRRDAMAQCWSNEGGILLTSDAMFRIMARIETIQKLIADADAIVLDESHRMLKKKDNQVSKAFMGIRTKRRICLTGTPFQNNLLEYYIMVSYIRPNLLGASQTEFQNEYIDPINAGMGTDAPAEMKAIADERLESLCARLKSFVNRKDASLLQRDLPPLKQVCLHLRPTKLQRSLYRAYKEHKRATDDYNFLKQYACLRLVHNHPGTLLPKEGYESGGDNNRRFSARIPSNGISNEKEAKDSLDWPFSSDDDSSDDDDDDYSDDDNRSEENSIEWWRKTAEKFGSVNMTDTQSGNKCIILLHILAHATILGEKTVVFTQSLKTLDFLAKILASEDWLEMCPSLRKSFPDLAIGGWLKGRDFLRLDGATSCTERGDQLNDFNWDKRLKLFLISSVAGGIGINLVSANHVVLFDSHFNPSIDLQAIYRCYRYGQKRRVFAYRLLTQGSMEERVYSRAVTKIGLGNRVVDGKELRRCFTTDEIDSLVREDDWVECVRCHRWRMFPTDHASSIAKLPKNWYCELMNEHDARLHWTCSVPEFDSAWYHGHFRKPNRKNTSTKVECGNYNESGAVRLQTPSTVSQLGKEAINEQFDVLEKLVTIVTQGENPTRIVRKHYFHDALVTDIDTAVKNCISPTTTGTSDTATATDRNSASSSTIETRNDGTGDAQGRNGRKRPHSPLCTVVEMKRHASQSIVLPEDEE